MFDPLTVLIVPVCLCGAGAALTALGVLMAARRRRDRRILAEYAAAASDPWMLAVVAECEARHRRGRGQR